ncbi:hypothetical protein [Nitrospira sp. Kam-Ns4a]
MNRHWAGKSWGRPNNFLAEHRGRRDEARRCYAQAIRKAPFRL